MPKVSVIIPFFNEQESLPALFDRLDTVINGATYADIDWEIMMVDDGSTDASPAIVMERRQLDPRIHIVRLSRNFGKEAAMLAGLDSVTGDCAVIMDADLQHPPEVIPQMVERWRAGADDIVGHRLSRGGESRLRYLLTRLYYSLASHLGASAGDLSSGDFRLMSRSMIDALRSIREADRYTKSLYSYVGFRTDSVDYVQEDRRFGTGQTGSALSLQSRSQRRCHVLFTPAETNSPRRCAHATPRRCGRLFRVGSLDSRTDSCRWLRSALCHCSCG